MANGQTPASTRVLVPGQAQAPFGAPAVPRGTMTTPEQNMEIVRAIPSGAASPASILEPLPATEEPLQARVAQFNQQGAAAARPRTRTRAAPPARVGGAGSLQGRTFASELPGGGSLGVRGRGGGAGVLDPILAQRLGIGRAARGGATRGITQQTEQLGLERAELQNQQLQQAMDLALRQQALAEQAQQAQLQALLTESQIAPEGQAFLGNLLETGATPFAQQTAGTQQAGQQQLLEALTSLSGLASDPLANPQLMAVLDEMERRFAEGEAANLARSAEGAGATNSALRALLETEGRSRLAGQQAQTILNAQLQAAQQLNPLANAIANLSTDPVFAQLLSLGQLAPAFQTQQTIGEVPPLAAFDPTQLALG